MFSGVRKEWLTLHISQFNPLNDFQIKKHCTYFSPNYFLPSNCFGWSATDESYMDETYNIYKYPTIDSPVSELWTSQIYIGNIDILYSL